MEVEIDPVSSSLIEISFFTLFYSFIHNNLLLVNILFFCIQRY